EVPPERGEDDDNPKQLMSFERRERDERDERWRTTSSIDEDGYAHVLVDEAQDLSPMQWRMVGRRGRTASWTIVGDEAQSSWPDPGEAREARDEALGNKSQHRFRLTKNYRNSAEVYELAAKVARKTIDRPDPADAVRRTGVEPDHRIGAVADLAGAARELVDQVDGSVAIVVPTAQVDAARAAVLANGDADGRVRVLE